MARRRQASSRLAPAGHRPSIDAPGMSLRGPSQTGTALLLAVLSLLVVRPAAAADDPATAGRLVSGVEGSKAALVRIEVSAIAEIAHIDHSTGDVHVARGRYDVPIRSGTGVFTSSDGVIATSGSTLTVTEDDVVVYAANRLFQEQMGTALVGNDGDLSRRAQAADPYWAPHLQHCYDHVEHCILFFVPRFTVLPYTAEPSSAPADLLRTPDGPGDVGLLRISGGGGTPTAELAPSGQAVPAQALLTGFTGRPDPGLAPSQTPVTVDPGTGALSSDQDVAATLAAGVAGGPVLDPATGQVAGLAATVNGTPTLIPAQRLSEVLEAAAAPPAGSQFDAVFRRGIDHMVSGHMGGSAASSFRESLTYYDSALAAQYLAKTAADEEMAPAPVAAQDEGSGLRSWVIAGGVAVLALLGLLLLLRRRAGHRGARSAEPATEEPPGRGPAVVTTVVGRHEATPRAPTDQTSASPAEPAAAARPRSTPAASPSPSPERTRLKQSPALLEDRVPTEEPPAFCWHCGVPLRGRVHYCGACGTRLS